jgi:hypothetical protein
MKKMLSGLVAAAFTLALVAPASAAIAPRVAADGQITQIQQTEKKAPAKKKVAKKKTSKKQTAKKATKKAPAKAA